MGLNLSFLRWKSKIKNFTSEEQTLFSRRHFLQGSASAVLTPDLSRFLLSDRIEFRHEGRRAAFLLDGSERWILDSWDFAGNPSLCVHKKTLHEVVVSLRDGRYPGTLVSSGIEVHAERSGLGWSCQIFLPQHGTKRPVDLRRWLEGREIEWRTESQVMLLPKNAPIQIRVGRGSRVSLDRSWRLRVDGDLVVTAEGMRGALCAPYAEVLPATFSPDPPLAVYDGLRSRTTIHSGKRGWDASVSPLLSLPFIDIARGEPLFNRLDIDTWDESDGKPAGAFSFSNDGDTPIFAKLHGDLKDEGGLSRHLSLVRRTYSFASGNGHQESAFFASLDKPTTAYADGLAVVFDGLVAITQDTTGKSAGITASIDTTNLHLKHYEQNDGTIFEFVLPANYRLFSLHLGHDVNWLERGFDAVLETVVSIFERDAVEAPLDGVTVRMVRPKDMLNLSFSFRGLTLKMRAGLPFIEQTRVKGKAIGKPYISVQFPPQNLQETSFPEDNNGNAMCDSSKPPPCDPAPAVKTSSSGPSWLKFRLDPSCLRKPLPLTPKALLDWSKFTFLPGDYRAPGAGSQIEVPYGLYLTLGSDVAFRHDAQPRTSVQPWLQDTPQNRAPELWGTLPHQGSNDVASGKDLEPISMIAFGAADVPAILQVQVKPGNIVRAFLSETISVLPPNTTARVYQGAGETSKYVSAIATQISAQGIDKNGPWIEYSVSGEALPTDDNPTSPDVALWLALPPAYLVDSPPMTTDDRAMIVAITSTGKNTPLTVNRLELTALGALFDEDSHWTDEELSDFMGRLTLRSWKHVMVLGRDSYVNLEYKGFLYPLGHKATYEKRTQRVFFSVMPVDPGCDKGQLYCYLRQQDFVQVKEKSRTYYGGDTNNPKWNFPFVQVDISTRKTPALQDPKKTSAPANTAPDDSNNFIAFAPQVALPNGTSVTNFLFDLEAYDFKKASSPVTMKAGLLFVGSTENVGATISGNFQTIQYLYEDNESDRIQLQGQHVHFAPSLKPGDTEQSVRSIILRGSLLDVLDPKGIDVNFYPQLVDAIVDLPPLQQLMGTDAIGVVVGYEDVYSSEGFPAEAGTLTNPASIYLNIRSTNSTLQFPGQHGGGIAKPSLPLQSISRTKGPLSVTVATSLPANLTPKKFFAPPGLPQLPKLFGVIPLEDLLPDDPNVLKIDGLPSMLTSLVDAAAMLCQKVDDLHDTYVKPTEAFLKLTQDVRSQLTAEAIRRIAVQTVTAGVQATILTPAAVALQSNLQTATTGLQTSLQSATAIDTTKINAACTQLQADLNARALALQNQVSDQIANSLSGAIDFTLSVEKTFDELFGLLSNAHGVGTSFLQQVTSLKNDVQTFLGDQFIKAIRSGGANISDLLTSFLKAELHKELTEDMQLAKQISLNLDGPLLSFDASFDQIADADSAAVNSAFTALQSTVTDPLKSAQTLYISRVATVQQAVKDSVTQAQEKLDEAVNQAINAGVDQLIDAVFQGSPIVQQVQAVAATQISHVLDFLTDLLTLEAQVEQVLNTPVSYGLNYVLPTIPLKCQPGNIFIDHGQPGLGPEAGLDISTSISAYISADQVLNGDLNPNFDYKVAASIKKFGIGLFAGDSGDSFLSIFFQSVTYTTRNQEHPKVDFRLGTPVPVNFGDDLSYVQQLEDSFGSMSSGSCLPLIEVSGDGVDLGWGFGVPDIMAGGFRMTGLAFSFAVHLSFSNDPLKLRFYFARPEKHFIISAGIYGGGGYFMVEAAPPASLHGGIDAFQLCLEFGATTALSLAAATGEAHIMAGSYIGTSDSGCQLTGYVRAGGSLNVIKILTLSLEIYIGVSYAQGAIVGEGSITVSISIAFFSKDVTVSMTWTWNAGGNRSAAPLVRDKGSPALTAPPAPSPLRSRMDYITPALWNEYAKAF